MSDSDWHPRLPPGRPLTLPGRGRVFVRDLPGPPGAPTLVLLHGWTATADLNWFNVYEPLAERFRVVAYDHRGHGRGLRTRRRFRLADCADDAAAVADALGIDRFVPVGYSMGGPVAKLVWQRHRARVDGLVLCATACRFGTTRVARAQMALLGPLALSSRIMPTNVAKPMYDRLVRARTRRAALQQWVLDEIMSCDPRHVLEAGSELRRFDSRGWASEIDVPTAVVVLDGDEVVPTPTQDDMVARLSDVRVWRIEGGHDACVRHPRRFATALADACEAVCAASGDKSDARGEGHEAVAS